MQAATVCAYAASIGDILRQQHWVQCGAHDVPRLPAADDQDGRQYRYCPHCWTVFSRTGSAMNPPRWQPPAN
jgi:hypothetical protein